MFQEATAIYDINNKHRSLTFDGDLSDQNKLNQQLYGL